MSFTDDEAREMMFGDLNLAGDEENSEDLDTEELDQESEEEEIEDIDIENDEEIKNLTKQSPKLNSAFAKIRREKEQIAKEKAEFDSKFQKYSEFVSQKYKNDYGIENLDQFFDYMSKQTNEEQEESYNSLKQDLIDNYGVDPNVVDTLIQNNPDFKKAQEIAKDVIVRQEQERLNSEYKSTFEELQAEYSQFKSIEDINKILGDKAQKFWELFKDKGLSMLEAYEVADRANLKNSTKKQAEQQTLNKLNSKAHLKPTKFNAEVDYTDVDQEELAWYEGMMGSKWSHQKMIEHSKANRR